LGKNYSEKFGHDIASSDFSNETFKNYKWQNLRYAFQQWTYIMNHRSLTSYADNESSFPKLKKLQRLDSEGRNKEALDNILLH